MATEGLSTGKTILIGTIVLGCFAVLWPKIFVPMLFGPWDNQPSKTGMLPILLYDMSIFHSNMMNTGFVFVILCFVLNFKLYF